MENSRNFIEFEVLGEEFKIKADVDEEYFNRIILYLKKKIGIMRERFPTQSNIRVLIFAAIDLIDELFQAKENLDKGTVERLTKLSEHLASVINEIEKG